MNIFLAPRYGESIVRLAFGLEPLDAQRGARVAAPLLVTLDHCPRPLDRWRPFGRGVLLDDVLPRMLRHDSGRYVMIFSRHTPAVVRVRISDPSRRYVPRKLRVAVPSQAAVAAGETGAGVAAVLIGSRVLRPHLHPGANADIASTVTSIRGRILHAGRPVPWCRIRANQVSSGDDFGFAHGDERGEFLLPLCPPPDSVVITPDPLSVLLTVGYRPSQQPPANDRLVPLVDPLWELFEELVPLPVSPAVLPAIGDAANGRTFPVGFATTTFVGPFLIPAGHARPVELIIP